VRSSWWRNEGYTTNHRLLLSWLVVDSALNFLELNILIFQLKRSKSYGRSMKTMLPWRPTLSKTLTKYVVKFEFLNDVIKKPKICYQMIFLLLKYAVKLIVTQDSCQINVFVMCAVYSYLLWQFFLKSCRKAVYDGQALK
jgi:hypothetical protein